jgi:hypothetical protein
MQEAQFFDVFATGMDVEKALRKLEVTSHEPIGVVEKEALAKALRAIKDQLLTHFTMEEETLFHGMLQVPCSAKEGHERLEKQMLDHQRIRGLWNETERLIHVKGRERLLALSIAALANSVRAHQDEEHDVVENVTAHMQRQDELRFRELYHQMHEQM